MKRLFVLSLTVVLLAGIAFAGGKKKYGKGVTLKEKTKISAILEKPADFVGKKVAVSGKILSVCQAAGCWMELESDKPGQKIKIKVKDGEIVFPKNGAGRQAIAEGTVYEIKLTKEEAIEAFQHQAEESGTTFDPATVTGPVTLYQIKGTGAEIDKK